MKSSGQNGVNTAANKRMTRRELLKYTALAGPILKTGTASNATPSRLPSGMNVIVFITDQERAIQHFPPDWETNNLPGLTRLKQNGLTFENAFTNACMCSPARSTLMSGYFPAQHGVKYTLEENMTTLANPQVELPVDLKNIATVMSAAGSNVVYKGKWHCSKAADAADLAEYGFQRWDPPDAGANQDPGQAGGGKANNDGRFMVGAPYNQEGVTEYLTSQAAAQQPFFLIVSLVNPHDVLAYPNNFSNFGYDDSALVGDIDIPATVNEDLSTKPTVQTQFLNLTQLGLGVLATPQMKRNYLNFYGNLMKASDNYLVELLDILENLRLLEDTLIIRTADHGEMGLTHRGQRQKNFNFYEESLRVPLVYSNPKLYKRAFKSGTGLPRRFPTHDREPLRRTVIGPGSLAGNRLLEADSRPVGAASAGLYRFHVRRFPIGPGASTAALPETAQPHCQHPRGSVQICRVLRCRRRCAESMGDVRPFDGSPRDREPCLRRLSAESGATKGIRTTSEKTSGC